MAHDGLVPTLDARMRALEIAASPLFPLASRSLRRAHLEAELRGLMCVPATYPLQVGQDGDGSKTPTLTLNVPQSEGALVVTDIIPPVGDTHLRQQMRARVGGTWMSDGYGPAHDVLTLPREYCGRLMSAPLVVSGGAQMQLYLSDSVAYDEAEGAQVNGLGVRMVATGRRELCAPPLEIADEWARAVRDDGEHWFISVIAPLSGAYSAVIPQDVVVEAVVIAETQLVETVSAVDVQIKVGAQQVTPGKDGKLFGTIIGTDNVVVMPGLRWPVAQGTQLVVDPTFPTSGTPRPVRATLIGRRGGIAGACW